MDVHYGQSSFDIDSEMPDSEIPLLLSVLGPNGDFFISSSMQLKAFTICMGKT